MKTIEENLDRIASALEQITELLGITSNTLVKAEQELSGTSEAITPEAAAPGATVDTATTRTRTRSPRGSSATGKAKIIANDIPPSTPVSSPEKTAEKTAEKSAMTFAPEGVDSLLTDTNATANVMQEDVIRAARGYIDAGKSVNDKTARKAKVIDVLRGMGFATVVAITPENYSAFIKNVAKLGA